MLGERVRNALCGLVALAWVANILVSMVNADYKPDPAVNGVFSGMIGAVLAASTGKKHNGDSEKRVEP